MLKITVEKYGKVKIEINGSVTALTAETLAAVRGIYESIEEKDKEAAREFKSQILEHIDLSFMSEEDFIRRTINSLERIFEDIQGFKKELNEDE